MAALLGDGSAERDQITFLYQLRPGGLPDKLWHAGKCMHSTRRLAWLLAGADIAISWLCVHVSYIGIFSLLKVCVLVS